MGDDDEDDSRYWPLEKPLTPVPHMISLVRDLASIAFQLYLSHVISMIQKRTLWPHLGVGGGSS